MPKAQDRKWTTASRLYYQYLRYRREQQAGGAKLAYVGTLISMTDLLVLHQILGSSENDPPEAMSLQLGGFRGWGESGFRSSLAEFRAFASTEYLNHTTTGGSNVQGISPQPSTSPSPQPSALPSALISPIPQETSPGQQTVIAGQTFEHLLNILDIASQQEVGPDSITTAKNLAASWEVPFNKIALWFDCPYFNGETMEQLAKLVLAGEAEGAQSGAERRRVYDLLHGTFLRTLISSGGRTARTTKLPTPLFLEGTSSPLVAQDDWDPGDRRDASFPVRVCLRDNGKEQIIGEFSMTLERAKHEYPVEYSQLLGIPDSFEDTRTLIEYSIVTDGAHIIPLNLAKFKNSIKTEIAKLTTWKTLLYMFPGLEHIVTTETINELRNVMTMYPPLHEAFGKFWFGLQHLEDETYLVVHHIQNQFLMHYFKRDEQNRPYVQFEYRPGTVETEKISRTLLAIHLAIGWVMNSTGAAYEFRYEDEEKAEETLVEAGGSNGVVDGYHFLQLVNFRLE